MSFLGDEPPENPKWAS